MLGLSQYIVGSCIKNPIITFAIALNGNIIWFITSDNICRVVIYIQYKRDKDTFMSVLSAYVLDRTLYWYKEEALDFPRTYRIVHYINSK
jgi:hypothetical protein